MSEKKEKTKQKGFRLGLERCRQLESRAVLEKKSETEIVEEALHAYFLQPVVNEGQKALPDTSANHPLLTDNRSVPGDVNRELTSSPEANREGLLTVNTYHNESVNRFDPEMLTPPADSSSKGVSSLVSSVAGAVSLKGASRSSLSKRPKCQSRGCSSWAASGSGADARCLEHINLEAAARVVAEAPPASTHPLVALFSCGACCDRRFLLGEQNGVAVASRCPACVRECSACNNRGEYLSIDHRTGYERWKPCGCKRVPIDRQLRALNAAQLPGAFVSLLVGRLPPGELTESQISAHLHSWGWARGYQSGERKGFFFYGPPGTGKTLSLCRALALLVQLERCHSVRYLHFPAYLDLRKQSFGGELTTECATTLVSPEVLVVDEILLQGKNGQARSFTEWERSQFDLLVHGRWAAGKPTLYATNYQPAQIEAEVSESTWSRIRSTAVFLEVQGRDLRPASNILPFKPRGAR